MGGQHVTVIRWFPTEIFTRRDFQVENAKCGGNVGSVFCESDLKHIVVIVSVLLPSWLLRYVLEFSVFKFVLLRKPCLKKTNNE